MPEPAASGPAAGKASAEAGSSAADASIQASGNAAAEGGAPTSEGGADTASFDIPTNTLTSADVPPIPPVFELLYVVGWDTPGMVHAFLPLGDMLYWVQQARIWRAPKDGSADPVAFGHYDTTNQGSTLLSDGVYIYWHDGDYIKRKRIDSPVVSLPIRRYNYNFPADTAFYEDTESLEYGGDYPLVWMDKDDTHLYIAHPSCTPIHKLNLQTLSVETFEFDRPDHRGGGGSLKVDAAHIYCANQHWLFRIGKDGSSPEVLYESFNNVWNITLSGEQVYVLDMPTGSAPPSLYAVAKAGGMKAFGQAPELGSANSYSTPLVLDESRDQLFWLGYSGSWLTALDLENGAFHPIYETSFTYAFGGDEDYLYWAGRLDGNEETKWTSVILRIHKDRLDELAQYQASLSADAPP